MSKLKRELDRIGAELERLRQPRGSTRSGAITWRSIGGAGDPWPAWLRAHKSACGVYAIKTAGRVVYVGSSRARLYDTITRHFQQWKRKKKWWSGAYGAGHDPGMTYARGASEIAVELVACGDELDAEARWIDRLHPRDNLVEHPDGELEESPF